MSFKDWKYWMNSLPWNLRWFVYLIILRPVIDNFYFLKEISPFLSPLILVGILTPVLCISAISNYGNPSGRKSDLFFSIWAFLLVVGAVLYFLKKIGINGAEFALKITLPVYLFYFLKRFIGNIEDIQGILYAAILATYISAIFLLYEVLFHPIQEVEFSRGVERLRGGYADVMNYGIYMSMGLLASTYFFLRNIKIKFFGINNIYLMLAFSILVVIKINHVASYIVFVALIVLFTLYSLRKRPGFGFLLILGAFIIGSYFGNKILENHIDPMIEKDVMVMEGKRSESHLLHGRVGRWYIMWGSFRKTSLVSKLFGTSGQLSNAYMMSSGAHNDFLRIIFTTGWIGAISYIFFLLQTFTRSSSFDLPENYLATASLSVTLIYSITTTPTYYANYVYILLVIFVFFTIPPDIAYQKYTDEEADVV